MVVRNLIPLDRKVHLTRVARLKKPMWFCDNKLSFLIKGG